MKNDIIPILVEKEGVSDDFYKISELYFDNGSKVNEGQMVLCIETSKVLVDIETPVSGYIFYNVHENDEVETGQIIAAISKTKTFDINWFATMLTLPPPKLDALDKNFGIQISKPAQSLIDKNNIDIAVFKGKSIITKEDVETYFNTLKQPILSNKSYDKSSLFILGGGGHGKMCIEIINKMESYKLIGIVDSKLQANETIFGVPVLGNENVIEKLIEKGISNVVLGVGAVLNHHVRRKLYSNLKEKGLFIPNIIHPSASIESSVQLGEGNQIMQGAIVGSNVKIGNNCIINSGSIVSHDTIIGNNVHIAPGAIIAGNVKINDDSVIGMGVTLFLNIKIGRNVIINNGINVFHDISDNEIISSDIK